MSHFIKCLSIFDENLFDIIDIFVHENASIGKLRPRKSCFTMKKSIDFRRYSRGVFVLDFKWIIQQIASVEFPSRKVLLFAKVQTGSAPSGRPATPGSASEIPDFTDCSSAHVLFQHVLFQHVVICRLIASRSTIYWSRFDY